MARYPVATWRGSPNVGGTAQRPARGLVVHVEVGTEAGTNSCFANPSFQASAHFGCATNGSIDQWVDTDDVAWAEVAGNPGWISVETEGEPSTALTSAQVSAIGALLAWLHGLYGFPLATCDHDGTGLTTHAHYPSGAPDASWGGHPCPGALRGAQLPAILAAAGANTSSSIDDALVLTLLGAPMALAQSDDDARRAIADRLYEADLGREPSVPDETFWAGQIQAKGLSFVIKAIFDSAEAQAYRKTHGG